MISYPQFTYDLFHMNHPLTYLLREHMNPKLTCSQRQWLHSSVGRASHRYREVTGSSPVEVLNFFRLLYAIVKIAIITARIILHLISYPQFTYDLFHMNHPIKSILCMLCTEDLYDTPQFMTMNVIRTRIQISKYRSLIFFTYFKEKLSSVN